MAGVYRLEISESEEELKEMLGRQKTGTDKERVQVLYLLKSKQAATVQACAKLIGRNHSTRVDQRISRGRNYRNTNSPYADRKSRDLI